MPENPEAAQCIGDPCVYEGPVQVTPCKNPFHNAAAKNLDRAQVMINKLEIKIEKILQKVKIFENFECIEAGCFNEGMSGVVYKRIHTMRCPRGIAETLKVIINER